MSVLENNKSNLISNIIAIIFFITSAVFMIGLLGQIGLYSDDYLFAMFFADGPKTFYYNTLNHYLYSNGRMLVHFLLQLTLLGGTKIYMFLCPLVVCLCCVLFLRLSDRKLSIASFCLFAGISIFLLIGLRTEILRSSLLWISGSFNFVLPMIFLLAGVYFYKTSLKKQSISALSVVFAFLAGATTEQYGFFSCIVLWGMWLMTLRYKEYRCQRMWLPPLVTLLGYLTVLISPGMWGRVDAETTGLWSFLDGQIIHDRILDISTFLFGADGCGFFLIIFCMVSASLVFSSCHYPRVLVLGYPVALALAVLNGTYIYEAGIVFFCYLFFLGTVFLCCKSHFVTGCLLLGSLGTQFILVITAVYGYRTALPMVLFLILCVAFFINEIFSSRRFFLILPVMIFILALSLHHFLPTYTGYAAAKVTMAQNIKNIDAGKKTGEIHLNMDVDTFYGYTPFYTNWYFYSTYLNYYHIDDSDIVVYFEGENYPSLDVNGERSFLPCVKNVDNRLFVPVSSTVLSLNGVIESKDSATKISLNGKDVWLRMEDNEPYIYDNSTWSELLVGPDNAMYSICGYTYISAEKLNEVFHLSVEYNKAKNSYEINTEV